MKHISTILFWMFGIAIIVLLLLAGMHASKDGKGLDPAVIEAIAEGFEAFSED
jgi:hypothetical protein